MTVLRGFFDNSLMDVGEATFPRFFVNSLAVGIGSGNCRLTYWTARKTETVKSIRTITGGTAASGLTLARMGVWTVAANGDLTRVADTTNDTALWTATNTAYVKDFSSTWTKVRGQRYATGICVVGTTSPTLVGHGVFNGNGGADELAIAPRLSGVTAAVSSDLPNAVANASIFVTTVMQYSVLVPA